MAFLRLIRFPNLLMIALVQIIFRYAFLKYQSVPLALNDLQYGFLIFATLCIAAGGYIINDIFDQETDNENKPDRLVVGRKISEAAAYRHYLVFTILGVAMGFFLSNIIRKPEFSAIFILISGLLYLYATTLKQSLLIGNVIVAFLLSMTVLIIGVYDLYPMVHEFNRDLMALAFLGLVYYAVFAFVVNLIREVVKDLEDVNGDYNQGMNTLPIALGVARASKIVFWAGAAFTVYMLYYVYTHFFNSGLLITTGYFTALVIAPLIYFCIRMWEAKTQKQFRHLSAILKLVLLFGMLSIAVITFEAGVNA